MKKSIEHEATLTLKEFFAVVFLLFTSFSIQVVIFDREVVFVNTSLTPAHVLCSFETDSLIFIDILIKHLHRLAYPPSEFNYAVILCTFIKFLSTGDS